MAIYILISTYTKYISSYIKGKLTQQIRAVLNFGINNDMRIYIYIFNCYLVYLFTINRIEFPIEINNKMYYKYHNNITSNL